MIVVTGATGFLGRHVVSTLRGAGYDVVGAARAGQPRAGIAPLGADEPGFVDVLERQPFALIHAAGAASVGGSLANPRHDFRSNVVLFADVLDLVREVAPGCRVILFSSAAVYGNPAELPVHEDVPLAPISPYGYHKQMAEELGRMYRRLYGVPFCALRIFSAYGRGLQRQVVYDIARKLREARDGRPIELHGTGRETRDFVHAEDVARAVACVLRGAAWDGEAYNLGSGRATTVADLAQALRARIGSPAEIRFNGVVREGDPLYWCADLGRLRSLGYEPSWSIEAGIADLISHWEEDAGGAEAVAAAPTAVHVATA